MAKRWLQLVLGFTLSIVVATAFAGAFDGTNPSTGKLTWSGFTSDGSVGATITGGIASGVNAGQFQGYFDTDGGSYEADDYFRFFCIDISHYANGGPNTYTRDLLGGTVSITPTQELLLTRLFDTYYPNKTTGTYYSGGAQTNFGLFGNANDSAAFQLALWEIWFGTGIDLANPPFTASSTAAATAQTWLNTINGEVGPAPGGWTFFTFTSSYYQDYLSAEWSEPQKQTPEPGTVALLCVAALAVGLAAMRRRQTA
jgi:hypothetical protein